MQTKEDIVFPDYPNSLLGAISSVLRHYGVQDTHATLPELDRALQNGPRNVVFMIFDGLGVDMLEHDLAPDDFFRRHLCRELTSVYPSTTAAATTTYNSGLSPLEHGSLGWSLYFKEYCRCIDIFPNQDSFSGEEIAGGRANDRFLSYKTIYERIAEAGSGVHTYNLQPSFIPFREGPHTLVHADDVQTYCDTIAEICQNGQQNFVYAYWFEPDSTMHKQGCYTDGVKEMVRRFSAQVEAMCAQLEDTLLIVSADHGLRNVEPQPVYLNEIEELAECLLLPPSMDARAASLFVRPDRKADFTALFQKHLGADFLLLTREEAFARQLFGPGAPHPKSLDFVGDFVACAVGDRYLKYRTPNAPGKGHLYFGHHAGLTAPEMVIPLILCEMP